MSKTKIAGIWIIGLIITLAAATYQRATGPTYPFATTIDLGGIKYDLAFVRSGSISDDAELRMDIDDPGVKGVLNFRVYPTNNSFESISFTRDGSALIAFLPKQKMAGKLEYYVEIKKGDETITIPHQIIRFKGDVPASVIIPHILFMFLTMFLSNVAGLSAVFNFKQFKPVGDFAFWSLLLGGMILGPVVQKYAFDELWAGVPFGWDLTDNKTLIAFVFWIIAFVANRRHPSRSWTIVAALVTLIIFAIPHSMFGSELNPETGEIIQGSLTVKWQLLFV